VQGGRDVVIRGKDVLEMGGKVGDDVSEFARRLKAEKEEKDGVGLQRDEPPPQPQQPQQRKRKLWLGIW